MSLIDWGLFASVQQWSMEVGRVAVGLLFLAGVVKCALILRRPGVSKLCVTSLLLLFVGWLSISTTGYVVRFVQVERILVFGGMTVALSLFAASLVTGIAGIVLWKSARPPHLQGIKQAIASAVLSPLGILLAGGLMVASSIPVDLDALPANGDSLASGEPYSFEQWNYQFTKPPTPWNSVDPSAVNSDASLCFTRKNPEIFFLLIAEENQTGQNVDSSHLVEFVLNNHENGGHTVQEYSRHTRKIGNLEGIELHYSVNVQGTPLEYLHWVLEKNGFFYQLLLWTEKGNDDQLNSASNELFDRFQLLDETRISETVAGLDPSQVSPKYGYRVSLDPLSWRQQAALKRELPGASFAAEHGGSASMVILPVWLHGEQVPADYLNASMLARMGFDVDSSEIKSVSLLKKSPLKGASIAAARNVDGVDFVYRMRVVEQGGFAYLLAAWKLAEANDVPISTLDSTLDAVTFVKPPAGLTTLSAEEQLAHALFFNDLGLKAYHSGDYKNCLKYFQRAFEFQHNDPAMLGNIVEAYRQLGRNTEAIEYLEQHGQEFESNPDVGLARAEICVELGNYDAAIAAYQAVFSRGYRNDDGFIGFINLLIERERLDEATELLESYLAQGDSLVLNFLRADIHQERGEYEQGINLLLELQNGRPFNAEIAYELADMYDTAEQYQEQLDVALLLLKNGHDNWYVYWIKALSEYGLHRYPEAKASLELALEENPTNEDIKSYLDHVSGLLGQGDNSAVKTPLEPVALSNSVMAEVESAAVPEDAQEADAVYWRDLTAIEFIPDESYKTTREFEVEVKTRAGVEQFSTLEIEFDPLSERIFVNQLVVRDASGDVISRGDPTTYYVVDRPSGEMVTQDKVLFVPVSGLRPNHRVEFRVTRSDLHAPEEIPFGKSSLATGYPSTKKAFFLRAPEGSVHFQIANLGDGQRSDEGWLWTVDDPPVYRYEQFQPPIEEYLPTLWWGSPRTTWANEVREYLERIQERLEPEPEVAEIAKLLTADDERVADQVLSLVDYVQQQFTYRGIEFGVRGQIPQTAATTIRNRYGDCKDHSLLLHQLLKARGIPSQLALVRSKGPIEKRIPSSDQFDHMILYVPDFQGGHFFDCTSKSGDLALATPSSLAGHDALLMDAELSEPFVRIPEYPPKAEQVDCRREIELLSSGDLAVRERVSVTGYWASSVRAYFRGLPQDERDQAMRQILASGGIEVTLEKHAIQGLEIPREPIVLWSNYRIAGAFNPAGGNLVGRLPSGWENEYLRIDYADSRLAPIKVSLPPNLHSKVRLKLPPGYVSQPIADWNKQSSTPYLDCRFRAASDQAGVLVNYEVHGHRGTFSPDEFQPFYEASSLPLTLLKRNVVVSPAASAP